MVLFIAAGATALACKKDEAPSAAPGAASGAAPRAATTAVAVDKKPAAGALNACGYVLEKEATEIFGAPSKYRSKDDGNNCGIEPVAENTGSGWSVEFGISTYNLDGWDATTKGQKPLAGLGDKAVIDATPGMTIVRAQKGTKDIQVVNATPQGKKPDDVKAKAVAVTQKILSRS